MPVSVPAREAPDPRTSGVLSAAVASTFVFSAAAAVPFLLPLGMVSPLPIIVLRMRGHLGAALLSTLLAAGLIGAVFTPREAMLYLAVLAAPGLLIGEAMARGRGLRRGCAWAFFLLAAEISVALVFAAPSIAPRVLETFDAFRSPQFLAEMRTRLPPENVDEWAEQARMLHSIMEVVYPAAFMIMGALVVLANGALLRVYLARRDPGWLDGGEFEGIRWPLGLAVAFVLSGAAVVFPPLRATAYNMLLIVAFFFALQGLAVVAYF